MAKTRKGRELLNHRSDYKITLFPQKKRHWLYIFVMETEDNPIKEEKLKVDEKENI